MRRLLRLSRKEGWDWLTMVALGQRGRSPIGASFLPREDSGLGRKRTGLRSSRKVSNRSHLEASQVPAQGLSQGGQSGPAASLENLLRLVTLQHHLIQSPVSPCCRREAESLRQHCGWEGQWGSTKPAQACSSSGSAVSPLLEPEFPNAPPHPEICCDNKCDCGYDYVYKTNVMENFIIIIVAYGEGEE